MRLLDSKTLAFHSFHNDQTTPEYAILSHCWGEDEVTFADMSCSDASFQLKKGFKKISSCAIQAHCSGFDFVWVDTCCIDKSSSAELSESINSMYRWYKNAAVCYAYLEDVETFIPLSQHAAPTPPVPFVDLVTSSRWFTRGWTLQELIAPKDVHFYDADWKVCGDKTILTDALQARTGVPEHVLLTGDLSRSSVAQKMSWAAGRITTRPEDVAYCLLGLFNINMPLLYGEGSRAFIRLQEEIMKNTNDMSLFAWRAETPSPSIHHGLLAPSPSEFAESSNMTPVRRKGSAPYHITNKGLSITLPLFSVEGRRGEFHALLSVQEDLQSPNVTPLLVEIYLRRVLEDEYFRVDPSAFNYIKPTSANATEYTNSSIFVLQNFPSSNIDMAFNVDRVKGMVFADSNTWGFDNVRSDRLPRLKNRIYLFEHVDKAERGNISATYIRKRTRNRGKLDVLVSNYCQKRLHERNPDHIEEVYNAERTIIRSRLKGNAMQRIQSPLHDMLDPRLSSIITINLAALFSHVEYGRTNWRGFVIDATHKENSDETDEDEDMIVIPVYHLLGNELFIMIEPVERRE